MIRQLGEFAVVIVVCQTVMSGQTDIAFARFGNEGGVIAAVQRGEVISRRTSLTHMVKDIKKSRIFLTIHLIQLDGYIIYLRQSLRTEEIRGVVIRPEQHLVLRCHHWRQLLQIANHHQLHPTKGLVSVAITTQHRVDGIEQVTPDHRDFIDNQQVERGDNSPFLLAKVELTLDVGIRHIRRKGQLEKRVDSDSSCIDGSHTCRCHHD